MKGRKPLRSLRAFWAFAGISVPWLPALVLAARSRSWKFWVRATQDEALTARLVGRQGAQNQVQLRFRNTGTKEDRSLYVDGFSLRAEPFSPPPAASGEKQPARPARSLIETAFSLKEGETIVVGTSKIDGGDEALVVLLTAVPVQ